MISISESSKSIVLRGNVQEEDITFSIMVDSPLSFSSISVKKFMKNAKVR